ncbi:spore coat protein [Rossellomorea vietnamensis]|uniref:Spore coat protein n=1 Tax=Rossellomorea vietnamensis TaxID=218284 RepID=A0A5D4NZ28_9BACI|nr:spore coat protein [Rossellomorea vietnamensis]TYS01602.1 spore coat protein [Rossellomorea vietnamensis]TYS18808.1 spore coat protein [Rossellomorea vietnamensis]
MEEKKWRALDHHCDDKGHGADVQQDADQYVKNEQKSYEWIIIKDSEGVDVQTTDTQAAVSLQLGIQAAIAAVISITIGDSDQGKAVAQDIKQFIKTRQSNKQKTIIENSKKVKVVTTDTDLAINIQALLQILVAIVVKLDVL